MEDRITRQPHCRHCGWWHPTNQPCPSPLEMYHQAGGDYESEQTAALRQGLSDETFVAGWERRHTAHLQRAADGQ